MQYYSLSPTPYTYTTANILRSSDHPFFVSVVSAMQCLHVRRQCCNAMFAFGGVAIFWSGKMNFFTVKIVRLEWDRGFLDSVVCKVSPRCSAPERKWWFPWGPHATQRKITDVKWHSFQTFCLYSPGNDLPWWPPWVASVKIESEDQK